VDKVTRHSEKLQLIDCLEAGRTEDKYKNFEIDCDQRSDHEGLCESDTEKSQWKTKNEENKTLFRSSSKIVEKTQIKKEIVNGDENWDFKHDTETKHCKIPMENSSL
jgi:hypothetical protein